MRFFIPIGLLAVTAGIALAQSAPHALPPAPKNWTMSKTPWGDPDIQGTWTSDDCIGTPMNRPANFGDRASLTEQEIADRMKTLEKQHEGDLKETVDTNQRVGTGPPGNWGERARRPCTQTSLVVEPANGRTPDLLPEAFKRPVPEGAGNNNPKADSWEDFSWYIRCISRGLAGSILPVIYGNGQQIIQGPGVITIQEEMVHEARVIHLSGHHPSPAVQSYMGDSRGHWEGNTLVVETTNFLPGRTGMGLNGGGTPTTEMLRLTERFTRISPDQMKYELTVDDPKTYVAPFKMAFPLTQEPGYQNFEYACHEGNYAMFDSLSGARAKEKAAAAKAAANK